MTATPNNEAAGVPPSEWQWYGLAAHFICAADCLFHMATGIGEYVVSTVGDLRHREANGNRSERKEIGLDRMYETCVFETGGSLCTCGCGMPDISGSEIDGLAANDPATARLNHMAMCAKYATLAQEYGNGQG